MEEKIVDILKSVLNTDNITVDSNQTDCEAWDSLKALSIIIDLESEFCISFEPEDIVKMNSVKAIAEIIRKKTIGRVG